MSTPESGAGDQDEVNVRLPKSVARRVENRLPDSGFKSVDEYVSYVVDAVLKEVEGEGGSRPQSQPSAFTKEDQEAVEQKLRELGYL